mgnify:CR=1 FL=1
MPKVSRSIDKALELTPEATTFIRGDTNSSVANSGYVAAYDRAAPAKKRKRVGHNSVRTKRRQANDSPSCRQVPQPAEHTTLPAGILVPVTTRLSLTTADALRRACLEQKLQRKSPSTQQEIVDAALRAWLVDNGYFAE